MIRRRDLPGLLPGVMLAVLAATAVGPSREALLAAAGVLLLWAVALALRARYPQRPLWKLLILLAVANAAQPLIFSADAALFALARAARPVAELVLVWVMLAYPSGRLQHRVDRGLWAAAVAAVLLLWLPGVMLAARVPPFGPFAACTPECPPNLFLVADRPQASALLLGGFRLVGAGLLLATSLRLGWRLQRATPLMRRVLAPVVLAALARALNVALFLGTGVGLLLLTFTLWAVPLAIASGLLRGRLYTARALLRLNASLQHPADLAGVRDALADALDDPGLVLATQPAPGAGWVDTGRQALALDGPQARQRVVHTIAGRDGRPMAVLLVDPALLEEPMLLEAIGGAIESALQGLQATAALQQERARADGARADERQRIERDLHDGAQQRLLGLRLKVAIAARLIDADARRVAGLLGDMDRDIEDALDELRALARGVPPSLLAEQGLEPALRALARRGPMPVRVEIDVVAGLAPAAEQALYYVAAEALQNTAKHAGHAAQATLRLAAGDSSARLEVGDDGAGLAVGHGPAGGQGLRNMRDRVQALGGTLTVGPGPGGVGTSVVAVLPRPHPAAGA